MKEVAAGMDPRDFFTIKGAVTVDRRRQFAGREDLIAKCLDALAVEGSALVLFGERGVGKTSLGWQVLGPLSGQSQLLEERRVRTRFPIGRSTCVWLTCSEFMTNAAEVMYSLIEDPDSSYSLKAEYSDVFRDEALVQRTYQRYKLKSANTPEKSAALNRLPRNLASVTSVASDELAAFLTLKDLLATAWEKYPDKKNLVVFLDEFDQVQDRAHVGILLKALNNVRFVLIGIAASRDKLLGHHASIGRKLTFGAFEVPLFGIKEVNWFFNSVESDSSGLLKFPASFRELVLKKSSGFPWLVQQLGFYSVLQAMATKPSGSVVTVDETAYRDIIHDFLQTQIGDSNFDIMDLSETQKRVLQSLSTTAKGRATERLLIDRLPSELRQYYEQAIHKLKDADLIYEQSEEVRIRDPLTKILIDLAREEGALQTRD